MTDILQIQDYFKPIGGLASHIDFEFELATDDEIDTLIYVTFGERNVAPVVSKTLSVIPTTAELDILGAMIKSIYGTKWGKQKALCKLQYDPIHNYEDTYTEKVSDGTVNTGSESTNSTDNRTNTETDTKTRTDNLSSSGSNTSTGKITSTDNDSTFGFNSSSASPTDSDSKEENSTDSTTSNVSNTGTQKNEESISGTDSSTKVGSLSKSYNIQNDVTKESKHIGNIGNLTTQQLMKQELELWKWNFVQSVLDDLKDFLTLSIYCS